MIHVRYNLDDSIDLIGPDGATQTLPAGTNDAARDAAMVSFAAQYADPVPDEVPMHKAKIALAEARLLAQVETAVAASPQRVQLAWEYAPSIRRDSQMSRALQRSLGMTDAQYDDLFRVASALVT